MNQWIEIVATSVASYFVCYFVCLCLLVYVYLLLAIAYAPIEQQQPARQIGQVKGNGPYQLSNRPKQISVSFNKRIQGRIGFGKHGHGLWEFVVAGEPAHADTEELPVSVTIRDSWCDLSKEYIFTYANGYTLRIERSHLEIDSHGEPELLHKTLRSWRERNIRKNNDN